MRRPPVSLAAAAGLTAIAFALAAFGTRLALVAGVVSGLAACALLVPEGQRRGWTRFWRWAVTMSACSVILNSMRLVDVAVGVG